MAYVQRFEGTLLTGTATVGDSVYLGAVGATSTGGAYVNGFVQQVYYRPATATGDRFATTAGLTWSADHDNLAFFKITGLGKPTGTLTRGVRQPLYGPTGAALLYATAGTAVEGLFPVVHERIKVTVAAGGLAKQGTVGVIIGG